MPPSSPRREMRSQLFLLLSILDFRQAQFSAPVARAGLSGRLDSEGYSIYPKRISVSRELQRQPKSKYRAALAVTREAEEDWTRSHPCGEISMSAREWAKGMGQHAVAERAQSIAASGRYEVTWKLYVEHKLKPVVQFYEKRPHPNMASALKRALSIYRNPAWRLKVLFIEGSNGERMEAAEINDWCERAPPED